MSNQIDESTITMNQNPRGQGSRVVGVLLGIIAFIILAGAGGFGYFQLYKMNASLTQQLSSLQQQVASGATNTDTLLQSVSQLQQSNPRQTQIDILNHMYAAQAQYLVRLANIYVQLMHNMPAALALMQQADETLQNVVDPNIAAMRQQVAQYIANMKAMPQVDIAALFMQLNALNNQIDQLPLPATPLQQDNNAPAPAVDETGMAWWQKGLNRSWQALRQIVIVRYDDNRAMPLILPEERNYLYQNLHAEMQNAMWGVLHHNNDVYQASLQRAISWIQRYFVQQSPVTTSVLQTLTNLQSTSLQIQDIDLSALTRQLESAKA